MNQMDQENVTEDNMQEDAEIRESSKVKGIVSSASFSHEDGTSNNRIDQEVENITSTNEANKAISSGQFNPGTISINLPISEHAGLKQVTINEVVEACKQSWAEQVEEEEGAFIPVKPKNKQIKQ